MKDCNSCAEKCPQAERAHQTALGRMYATNELVSLLKKIDSGELAPVVHGQFVEWYPPMHMVMTGEEMLFRCSACDAKYSDVEGFRFCPHCGALMDGKDDT